MRCLIMMQKEVKPSRKIDHARNLSIYLKDTSVLLSQEGQIRILPKVYKSHRFVTPWFSKVPSIRSAQVPDVAYQESRRLVDIYV